MRIAVVSDIHSNGEALDAVARKIESLRPDRVVHLGDLTGYNAEPDRCVRWVRDREVPGVVGNHDAVVAGRADGRFFHAPALAAARWSAAHVSRETLDYLGTLPESLRLGPDILLVHGAPSDPDRYLFLPEDAEEEIHALHPGEQGAPRVVFFGHTHVPCAFVRRRDGATVSAPLEGFRLGKGEIGMLNPGSVGQPRDRDPRASFLLYDADTGGVEWLRVPYDVPACQRKVTAAGLPPFFAGRLEFGT